MSVRILTDKNDEYSCFYCSTTMWAFGPIMYSYEEAEDFLKWLGETEPRILADRELENKYFEFRKEREAQELKKTS